MLYNQSFMKHLLIVLIDPINLKDFHFISFRSVFQALFFDRLLVFWAFFSEKSGINVFCIKNKRKQNVFWIFIIIRFYDNKLIEWIFTILRISLFQMDRTSDYAIIIMNIKKWGRNAGKNFSEYFELGEEFCREIIPIWRKLVDELA